MNLKEITTALEFTAGLLAVLNPATAALTYVRGALTAMRWGAISLDAIHTWQEFNKPDTEGLEVQLGEWVVLRLQIINLLITIRPPSSPRQLDSYFRFADQAIQSAYATSYSAAPRVLIAQMLRVLAILLYEDGITWEADMQRAIAKTVDKLIIADALIALRSEDIYIPNDLRSQLCGPDDGISANEWDLLVQGIGSTALSDPLLAAIDVKAYPNGITLSEQSLIGILLSEFRRYQTEVSNSKQGVKFAGLGLAASNVWRLPPGHTQPALPYPFVTITKHHISEAELKQALRNDFLRETDREGRSKLVKSTDASYTPREGDEVPHPDATTPASAFIKAAAEAALPNANDAGKAVGALLKKVVQARFKTRPNPKP